MLFRRNLGKFLTFEFFDLEDIDLGAPKLHAIEIYNQTTSHKNLVILAFIEAELAVGQILPPPPFWARKSEPHSRARVKGATSQQMLG